MVGFGCSNLVGRWDGLVVDADSKIAVGVFQRGNITELISIMHSAQSPPPLPHNGVVGYSFFAPYLMFFQQRDRTEKIWRAVVHHSSAAEK